MRRAQQERLAALVILGIAAVLIAIAVVAWLLGHGWMTLILGIMVAVMILGAIGGFVQARIIERREERS
ncbi:membrane protein [Microbacterium phage FuzzBuster]|uniref:Membrane protein n=1 Tax=Microbacterium phage FuzzBuster TaxID=2590935 RepID=A0A516KUZ0_9CAUD|nr:membrane protein [Microbacterium phage FuzzBuster]